MVFISVKPAASAASGSLTASADVAPPEDEAQTVYSADGQSVTDAFVRWCRPLAGEGLPVYLSLK